MIKIVNLGITQPSPTYTLIAWYLEPTIEDLSNYTVYVYRSELPSSNIDDYTVVSSGLQASSYTEYYDTSINGLTNKFDTWNYLITVTNNQTQAVITSKPVSIIINEDKYARFILASKELVLNRHSGADFKLLKLKSYGTYCPNCFDPTLQLNVNPNCPVCFGTSFVGGYYTPYTFRGQVSYAPPRSVITTFGQWMDLDSVLYTTNKPIITPSDIILDPFGKRWNVVTKRTINKALFILEQQLQLRQLESGSIIYSVPI